MGVLKTGNHKVVSSVLILQSQINMLYYIVEITCKRTANCILEAPWKISILLGISGH